MQKEQIKKVLKENGQNIKNEENFEYVVELTEEILLNQNKHKKMLTDLKKYVWDLEEDFDTYLNKVFLFIYL